MQNILNHLLLPFSTYCAYSEEMPEWDGCYRFMNRCVAFKAKDGTLLFTW